MQEHAGVCEQNPDRKGPYFCRVEGCSKAQHLFQKMKNLNHHMDRAHGWRGMMRVKVTSHLSLRGGHLSVCCVYLCSHLVPPNILNTSP